jgi:hypothetical protein
VAIVGVKPLLLRVARSVELYDIDIIAPGQKIGDFLYWFVLRLLVCRHRCLDSPRDLIAQQ